MQSPQQQSTATTTTTTTAGSHCGRKHENVFGSWKTTSTFLLVLFLFWASVPETSAAAAASNVFLRPAVEARPPPLAVEQASPSSSQPEDDASIIGGVPAAAGEFPWFVHFGICGGSLVHDDIVLTAAHCGDRFPFLVGREVRINSVMRSSGGLLRTVTASSIHPRYGVGLNGGSINDIMVLQLDAPVPDSMVTPIRLNRDPAVPVDNSTITVIGHGVTEIGSTSEELRKVDLLAVSDDTCSIAYRSYDPQFHLCAGVPEGGRDSCQGDSGGPLFTNGTNIQVAIVSYGRGCALPGFPGVNTRVSTYAGWVDDQICDLTLVNRPASCDLSRAPTPSPAPTPEPPPTTRPFDDDFFYDDFPVSDDSVVGGSSSEPWCFPGNATVHVHNHGPTFLRNLRLGDMVLVDSQTEKYEPVYTFGHKIPHVTVRDFLKINVVHNNNDAKQPPLTLSRDHMVFVKSNNGGGGSSNIKNQPWSLFRAVPASQIQVGDTLQMAILVDDTVTNDITTTATTTTATRTQWVNVTDVQQGVVGHGLYAPFTPSGSLVVNGIRVSVFSSLQGTANVHVGGMETSLSHHWLYQTLLTPLRVRCGVAWGDKWSFGKSALVSSTPQGEDYVEGISYWLYHHWRAYQWWARQDTLLQWWIGGLFVLWTLAMALLDGILQNPLAAMSSLVIVVGLSIFSRRPTATFID